MQSLRLNKDKPRDLILRLRSNPFCPSKLKRKPDVPSLSGLVANITNICYGRGVGYKIEEIVLDEKIQQISATKIRAQMRKEGKLK